MLPCGLLTSDFNYVVTKLPRSLQYKLIQFAKDGKQFVVAGGYIRSMIAKETVNDIDIFCINAADAQEFALALCPDRSKHHETENAISFTFAGRTVQVISRFVFKDVIALLRHFDFTIAQAAIWHDGKKWCGIVSNRFYYDLAAKRLYYTTPEEPEAASTMLRILKFYKRGYTIDMESLAQVIGAITSTEPEAIEKDFKEISPAVDVNAEPEESKDTF